MYEIPTAFLVHFGDIDDQHRGLTAIVNRCLDAAKRDDGLEFARHFENFITTFSRHFDYEEDLMGSVGYKHTQPHKNHHRESLDTIRALRGRDGRFIIEPLNIPPILFNQIVLDIAKADLNFEEYIAGRHMRDAV